MGQMEEQSLRPAAFGGNVLAPDADAAATFCALHHTSMKLSRINIKNKNNEVHHDFKMVGKTLVN